ncbi:MAG: PTS sugar transporter [Deltaproteobacteria bacterium]|nr:PTS sugar transporter [Deltaproteobacteria bacterium]MBW2137797.1 PTS sugar transporter [Deltaproteobacteria bacterium]
MVSLLIVTHCDLGKEFLNAAEFIVGRIEAVDTLSITQTNDSEAILSTMKQKIAALKKQGDGVLILTDMFGGTPSNISLSFLKEENVEVLTGVNLPMVIAIVQNRKNLGLKELAETAQAAGKTGISVAGKLLESE